MVWFMSSRQTYPKHAWLTCQHKGYGFKCSAKALTSSAMLSWNRFSNKLSHISHLIHDCYTLILMTQIILLESTMHTHLGRGIRLRTWSHFWLSRKLYNSHTAARQYNRIGIHMKSRVLRQASSYKSYPHPTPPPLPPRVSSIHHLPSSQPKDRSAWPWSWFDWLNLTHVTTTCTMHHDNDNDNDINIVLAKDNQNLQNCHWHLSWYRGED